MSISAISGGISTPPPVAAATTETGALNRPSAVRGEPPVRQPESERITPSASPEETQLAVKDAVQRANTTIQALRSNLKFTVDEATGIQVVKFIDVKTEEVIRQIPSEEMLALARRLDELKGLLIKDKA